MNKIIFLAFAFVFVFAVSATNIFACSCSLPKGNKSIEQQVKEAFKNSTVVFSGEVLEVIKKPDNFFVTVRFKLEKTWSNKDLRKDIIVSTGQGSGDCGYPFEVGKSYLVYAYGETNSLKTNICYRTTFIESNKDIAVLNKIRKAKIKSFQKQPVQSRGLRYATSKDARDLRLER
jgi:hypothetical protein